jgi:hypothetical protein
MRLSLECVDRRQCPFRGPIRRLVQHGVVNVCVIGKRLRLPLGFVVAIFKHYVVPFSFNVLYLCRDRDLAHAWALYLARARECHPAALGHDPHRHGRRCHAL